MASPLYYGEDMDVKWTGAKNEAAGTYLNAATASWVLKDITGATVSSGSLSYVAASNGNYLGVIQSTVTVTLGAFYVCEVTLAEGDYNGKRFIDLQSVKRGTD